MVKKKSSEKNEILQKFTENQLVLRMICHDMANPLAIMLTSLSICEQSSDISEIKNFLGKMRRAADEQKMILRHLRDARALLSGSAVYLGEGVALKEEVSRILELYQDALASKGQKVNVDAQDALPLVQGDKLLIASLVIKNLLDNAIKFSGVGSTITIRLQSMDAGVQLVVKDEGEGIPSNLLRNIFDLEFKEITPGTEGERGVGYGLPLLKLYLDRTGGRIEIRSKTAAESPGSHGTTVSIWLPCHS